MPIHGIELDELPAGEAGASLVNENMDLIKDVKVTLQVVVGGAEISVGELFALGDASIVKLDRDVAAPVDVLLNGKVVARGALVVVDDNFGVRITETKR